MPTLSDWNWFVLMLGEAMLGVISDNFRLVALRYVDDHWVVETILLSDNIEDREELEDAIYEFDILTENLKNEISPAAYTRIESNIIVSDAPIDHAAYFDPKISRNVRVVFSRRDRW